MKFYRFSFKLLEIQAFDLMWNDKPRKDETDSTSTGN
jgi:hypothetical protein